MVKGGGPITARLIANAATFIRLLLSLEEPIAFFTALQIVSRENGFSRKSVMQSFCALSAMVFDS